jgi:hypothetical protein
MPDAEARRLDTMERMSTLPELGTHRAARDVPTPS